MSIYKTWIIVLNIFKYILVVWMESVHWRQWRWWLNAVKLRKMHTSLPRISVLSYHHLLMLNLNRFHTHKYCSKAYGLVFEYIFICNYISLAFLLSSLSYPQPHLTSTQLKLLLGLIWLYTTYPLPTPPTWTPPGRNSNSGCIWARCKNKINCIRVKTP